MVNPLNLCERLIQDWITEKELEILIDFDYLERFATRNNLSMVKMIDKNGNKSYRIVRKNVPVCFISGANCPVDYIQCMKLRAYCEKQNQR